MFYIVHVGKCGGGTIFIECKRRKIKFEKAHLRKPKIRKRYQYVILIRDPINRFISAFNWKMFRCLTKEGQNIHGKKPYQNTNESTGFKFWKNINNFAENLFDENGNMNHMASHLIKYSNHLQLDIHFYLENLIKICNSKNCQVIRHEYYNEDINQVLNIKSVKTNNHKNNYRYSKYISDKGRQNLKKLLKKDYECFQILKNKNIIDDKYYHDIISGNFN